MCISVLPSCMYVHRVCVWYPKTSDQKKALIGSHGTSRRDGCEPSCGRRGLNLGPLQEQRVLLTSEPFFFLVPWAFVPPVRGPLVRGHEPIVSQFLRL